MTQRRKVNTSSESGGVLSDYSAASSIARNAQIAQLFLSAIDLAQMPDPTILSRSLSLRSVISTTSSFRKRFQLATKSPHLQEINQIGIGMQGAVFEQVGHPLVFKKEIPGNEHLSTNLRHEFTIHRAFLLHCRVWVPKPFQFIAQSQDHEFLQNTFSKLPQKYRVPSDVVKMERILPLPKVIRRALINQCYCHGKQLKNTEIESVLQDTANKHCLARVYLGKKCGTFHPETLLRNIPLYLDMMESVGIDTLGLATMMGKAYVILHWGAGVDGDDVELVLGSAATGSSSPDFQHREIRLDLLDFGQCTMVDFDQDPDIIYQPFKGAMVTGDNQDFIPRPTSPALFTAFKEGYLETGNLVLAQKKETRLDLQEFISQYEEYAEDFL
ncbi:hypothetical protein N7493_007076 [Penicillium malachiteum]|uniref:DUF3669 domain-containing protein n=1 Tax=Penicillium malachiteum TaxID=1324776 RepID=A0AAD6HJY7_9EURO|nr:hypothetical protein N7493_007076 [Penicillium malachiteum]